MITVSTRKTKDGYFQPVLTIDGIAKHTPKDWSEPSLDRATALKYGHAWKNESLACGYITNIG
jgi:hypothetical protein